MELELEVQTGEACYFIVNDMTSYVDESLVNEDMLNYKYSETVSIVLLNKKKFDKDLDMQSYIFNHSSKEPLTIPTQFNGIFDFYYIVLPTKESLLNKPMPISETDIYYFDAGNIYRLEDNTQLDFLDLLNFDPEGTNISMVATTMTSICFIKRHFQEICCKIYDKRLFNLPLIEGTICNSLIKTRDTLWVIINLVSYYTDRNEPYEALRLIEKYNNLFMPKKTVSHCCYDY